MRVHWYDQAARLANEAKALQSAAWSDKGTEAERDIKLHSIAVCVLYPHCLLKF